LGCHLCIEAVVNALALVPVSIHVQNVLVILKDVKLGETITTSSDGGVIGIRLSVRSNAPDKRCTGGECAALSRALPVVNTGAVWDTSITGERVMVAAAVVWAIVHNRVGVVAVHKVNALASLGELARYLAGGKRVSESHRDERGSSNELDCEKHLEIVRGW